MTNKHIIILAILSITVVSATLYLSEQNGVYTYNIRIEDGEYMSTNAIINEMQDENLITVSDASLFKSAIVRSFDNDTNQVTDFVTYTNHVSANRNLGYWSNTPILYYDNQIDNNRISDPIYAFSTGSGIDWEKAKGFTGYYHRIFRNSTARSALLSHSIDFVCALCKRYPSDFRNSLLQEIDLLIRFTQRLQTLGPNLNTDNLRNYWEGFIYRRYTLDNISPAEIERSLIQAQQKVKAVDVTSQPSAMYEIVINNAISLLYSSETLTIKSKVSGKEIRYNYDNYIERVRYLKDSSGDYYQIIGTKNGQQFSTLYNSNLISVD